MSNTSATSGIDAQDWNVEQDWVDHEATPKLLNLGTSDEDIMRFMVSTMSGPDASPGKRAIAQMLFARRQEMTQMLSSIIESSSRISQRIFERFSR